MSSLDVFMKEWYTPIALRKMRREGSTNFRIYCVGWLETGGPSDTWDTLEIIGAEFREVKRGPRKGQLGIMVPGTIVKAYVGVKENPNYEEKVKS
ncbi:hypothetical protein BcepF1.024 [Burkholderia phage BcepF1]|uniref:Uncharacterized protein n=1 Tax=Burkholderia phage BcepF1 TaxID=2886897 RepID=A1YZS8_9CAUD|nr:hypothetical protein BcepF1.024 [Burkholderia phage BcepF1]ABL96755.1 hypothetical protein BcepF1.024 [Burkholderia phage BcepF1]